MADTGFGIAITFASGFFAEIRNVDGPELSRGTIDTSHAGTTGGYRTFIFQDLLEGGAVDIDMLFDPNDVPPIDDALETVTITFPLPAGGLTPATWAFSGGLTNYRPTAPYDDLMTATATLKVAGAITYTAST